MLTQQFNEVGVFVQISVFAYQVGGPSQQGHLDQIVVFRITTKHQMTGGFHPEGERIEAGNEPLATAAGDPITPHEAWSAEHTVDFAQIGAGGDQQALPPPNGLQ